MRKRILALALSMAMILGLVTWQPVYAAGGAQSGAGAYTRFYDQLTKRAQEIYGVILTAYNNGTLKDGKTAIPLTGAEMDKAAAAYLQGNRALFNDFSAAKDAFDLEHPEAWYFDSAQLSLTAESTSATTAKASMGIGKSDSYYVMGVKNAEDVEKKTADLEARVKAIADDAQSKYKDDTYEQIKYVHDEVIKSISYKYEFECVGNASAGITKEASAGAVRTAYALITGEGVCEGYVRSFQMILNKLGIPCVPIHGTQTSNNDPQQHMWCAVYISDSKGTGWYVVDPTWDDPLPNGNERDTYFMVGNDKITGNDKTTGNWIPSGYVSTGTMEFRYPSIAPRSYGAGQIESNGLVVTYDDGLMEGLASTVYRISYNGMGLYEAQQKEYYFLIKMYDVNADGSEDVFEDWYYAVHGLLLLGDSAENFKPDGPYDNIGSKYYHDTKEYLVQNVSNCEYVEFAVTNVAPPKWKTTTDLLPTEPDPKYPNAPTGLGGYLKDSGGTEADIIAQTGLIYNPNGSYEQPPYAKNVSPAQNETTYVGATHTIHMEFTDPLYHPDQAAINKAAAIGKVNEAETAMKENVGLDYTGENHSWGVNGGLPHQFANRPVPQNVRWYCTTEGHGIHTDMSKIGSACRLTTLEFEFTPSVMWADDSVAYRFFVTGLVGAKSNKTPERTSMSFVFENASCSIYYRCPCRGGIDWNLWGQPQLLDDPNNLIDQLKVNSSGNPNDASKSLADLFYHSLDDQRREDQYDMNGRLLLVVEDAGANKAKADAMAEQLLKGDEKSGVGSVDLQNAIASALYEIDFARICGQTVVETGQSLRMQVGFPAGFDVSKLSGTVFKVYHFTKDKTTGEITGVEEIPVTVTPYGLVFQVKSFSPFAIVAEEVEKSQADNSRSVVLVSGGHGKITSNYTLNGNEVEGTLKLTPTTSYTITIEPDDGYALESVTATGISYNLESIGNNGGTFTLSYKDIGATNAMIGVTFVKLKGDEAAPKVDVVSLCSHTEVESSGGKAATCMADGKAPTVKCKTCKQVLSNGEVIPATGHVFEAGENYKEPTCTEPGTALKCKNCDKVSQAPALGHDYDKGVCTRCNDKEQCTVTFNPNGGKIKSGSATIEVGANSKLTAAQIPVVERSGYKLSGWLTAEGKQAGTITRSVILYAEWSDNTTGPGTGDNTGGNNSGGDNSSGDNNGGGNSGGGNNSGGNNTGGDNNSGGNSGGGNNTGGNNTGGNNSGGNNSGGNNSGGTTHTETSKDGTVTTTVTNSTTGATTVTVKRPDGSVSVTETYASGNVSRRESFADGVKILTEIPAKGSVSASVTVPAGMASASVTIQAPVTAGTVAVNSATGEVVMLSVPVDGGLKVVLNGSADIVLVDLSKDFDDMPDRHWAANSVDFVTSHGLFNGTGGGKFSPNANMTRAMLMTVLARFNGVDTDSGSTWYGPGMEWAVTRGISDGTNPNADITREQLAVMLYRYAGSPEVNGAAGSVSGYSDAYKISDWASQAMRWAVQNGILQGSNGHLNPGSKATRSEVSAMIERFCRNVAAAG